MNRRNFIRKVGGTSAAATVLGISTTALALPAPKVEEAKEAAQRQFDEKEAEHQKQLNARLQRISKALKNSGLGDTNAGTLKITLGQPAKAK